MSDRREIEFWLEVPIATTKEGDPAVFLSDIRANAVFSNEGEIESIDVIGVHDRYHEDGKAIERIVPLATPVQDYVEQYIADNPTKFDQDAYEALTDAGPQDDELADYLYDLRRDEDFDRAEYERG